MSLMQECEREVVCVLAAVEASYGTPELSRTTTPLLCGGRTARGYTLRWTTWTFVDVA